MKTKSIIREKIKELRLNRNDAKQFENAAGYINISDGSIRALEWVLGYKKKVEYYWCFGCAITHANLKCPKCGSETLHKPGAR